MELLFLATHYTMNSITVCTTTKNTNSATFYAQMRSMVYNIFITYKKETQ